MRLPTSRAVLFASGDFACNLYWQSLSFFLFFFYTEALRLPAATAGLILLAGSIWDGLADAAVGMHAQRSRRSARWFLGAGAAPLGLGFISLYYAPPLAGMALAVVVLAAHLLFRSLYAFVNIPYSAASAQVTSDSRQRSQIAALRMLFGTAAALAVAFLTQRIAERAGGLGCPDGYLHAAMLFAAVGTALLLLVGMALPTGRQEATSAPASGVRACLRALARNRAFVTLNLAAAIVGIGATVLARSVLHYFRYVVGDAAAGTAALAMMGVAGAIFVPLWMFAGGRLGMRAVWMLAALLGTLAIGGFGLLGGRDALSAEVLLVIVQAALVGTNLAYWSMLPDTVEYGERHTGVRVEAMAFGVSALVQKLALGLAAALVGIVYDAIGYVPSGVQPPGTLAGIQLLMLLGPALCFALSMLAMAANPLRRGTHAAIVAELAHER